MTDTSAVSLPYDQEFDMVQARKVVEGWATLTIGVGSIGSDEIIKRLTSLSILLPKGDSPPQNFVQAWLMELEPQKVHRGQEVQNRLLDLWGTF